MKHITKYLLVILLITNITSCIPPSEAKIEKMESADGILHMDFEVLASGEILYQFYHKYGFTDIEEQFITIIRCDEIEVSFLDSTLPLDTNKMKELSKIDIRKFRTDSAAAIICSSLLMSVICPVGLLGLSINNTEYVLSLSNSFIIPSKGKMKSEVIGIGLYEPPANFISDGISLNCGP